MNQQPIVSHEAPIHGSQNLPVHPPERLFGRDADLASIHLALKAGTAVLLHGPAGVGKTALAAVLASGYAELPGGVLWLEGVDDTPRSLLNRVARAYGIGVPADSHVLADQVQTVEGILQQNRPLIVLDGHLNLDIVREFVRMCSTNMPLILTHSRLAGGAWTPQAVMPLAADDANVMLLHLAGPAFTPDEQQMNRLFTTLAGHAFSISVAGQQFASGHVPINDFLAQIPGMPPGAVNNAMGILMAVYRLLPSTLQGFLLLLGSAFLDDTSEDLLVAVSGASESSIQSMMSQLVNYGLVSKRSIYGQTHFVVHELVQSFAQAFLRGKKQLESMRQRHLEGIQTFVQRCVDMDELQRDQLLAANMNVILAAGQYAATHEQINYLEDLVQLLDSPSAARFVESYGWGAELEWLNTIVSRPGAAAMGVLGVEEEAAPAPGDVEPADSGPAFDAVEAIPLFEQERFEQVVPDTAPEVVEAEFDIGEQLELEPPETHEDFAIPDELPEAELERDLGEQATGAGQTEEAISHYAHALETYQADGNIEDELAALEALAQLSLERADYENVLNYVDKGMELAQESENPLREGQMLVLLGDLQTELGRFEGAEVAYQEAVSSLRSTEAWLEIGKALQKLGELYLEQGRGQDATPVLEQTLPIYERVERQDLLASAQGQLGEAYALLHNWDQAQLYLNRALENARVCGDNRIIFEQLFNLGELAETQGQRDEAVSFFQQALYWVFQLDDKPLLGETLYSLGHLLVDDTTQLNRVIQLLEEAKALLPDDTEVQRLLGRAKKRHERLVGAGIDLLPPKDSLHDYAQPPTG